MLEVVKDKLELTEIAAGPYLFYLQEAGKASSISQLEILWRLSKYMLLNKPYYQEFGQH